MLFGKLIDTPSLVTAVHTDKYRILPSTLVLVMCALEVLEWASAAT